MGKRLQTYETGAITVTFDPNLCIHARECVRGLPEVFDPTSPRWIRPERAAADRVIEVVRRCPTGALQVKGPDVPEPVAGPVTVIRVRTNGPLYVTGQVRLEREDGTVLREADRMSLCRCGATGNPPFCDGSHERLG
jgi:uncharacterized Fe-S cluster protein YjdI